MLKSSGFYDRNGKQKTFERKTCVKRVRFMNRWKLLLSPKLPERRVELTGRVVLSVIFALLLEQGYLNKPLTKVNQW